MIKQTIIAGMLVAFASTPAFSADTTKAKDLVNKINITPFGEIRAYVEASSANAVDTTIKSSSSHIGIKADANAGITNIFGELSVDVDINSAGADDLTTRYGYVGVSAPIYGALSIGKQQSIQESFVDKADIFYNGGNTGVQKMSEQLTNTVKYENSIGGIKVGGLIQATNDASNEEVDKLQLGAEFKGVGIAYAKDNVTDDTYYGIGASRKYGKILVAGSYSILKPKTGAQTRGFDIAGGYDMSDDLTLKAGFSDTDAVSDDGVITGGAEYKLGYSAVAFSTVDYDRDATDWTARTGISIKF